MAAPLEGLFDLFAPWRRDAACKGLGHERFFPVKATGEDSTQSAGKAVCAQCPVLLECLEDSMVHNDDIGLWGGAGEAERRQLRKAWVVRGHGPGVLDGCSCSWCRAVRRHLLRLDGERPKVRDRNGPGATHGRRVTYARGCRCAPCRWSASMPGQLVARCGEQTAVWWGAWVDEGASDAERWASADAAAGELLVDVMVGWTVLVGADRAVAVAAAREWFARWSALRPTRAVSKAA